MVSIATVSQQKIQSKLNIIAGQGQKKRHGNRGTIQTDLNLDAMARFGLLWLPIRPLKGTLKGS